MLLSFCTSHQARGHLTALPLPGQLCSLLMRHQRCQIAQLEQFYSFAGPLGLQWSARSPTRRGRSRIMSMDSHAWTRCTTSGKRHASSDTLGEPAAPQPLSCSVAFAFVSCKVHNFKDRARRWLTGGIGLTWPVISAVSKPSTCPACCVQMSVRGALHIPDREGG